jgi:hypothetical protein
VALRHDLPLDLAFRPWVSAFGAPTNRRVRLPVPNTTAPQKYDWTTRELPLAARHTVCCFVNACLARLAGGRAVRPTQQHARKLNLGGLRPLGIQCWVVSGGSRAMAFSNAARQDAKTERKQLFPCSFLEHHAKNPSRFSSWRLNWWIRARVQTQKTKAGSQPANGSHCFAEAALLATLATPCHSDCKGRSLALPSLPRHALRSAGQLASWLSDQLQRDARVATLIPHALSISQHESPSHRSQNPFFNLLPLPRYGWLAQDDSSAAKASSILRWVNNVRTSSRSPHLRRVNSTSHATSRPNLSFPILRYDSGEVPIVRGPSARHDKVPPPPHQGFCSLLFLHPLANLSISIGLTSVV